jgi:hypothetical protein
MPNRYLFADEAGCFTFKRKAGASRYFLLCTLTTDDCSFSRELLDIRRDLCAGGESERTKLHATSDSQATRDRVFEVLAQHEFRVDATILEKSKAQPQTRTSDAMFYQYAWYYHFKHIGPLILPGADKLLITAAALGQTKTKAAFKNAVNNTVQQTTPTREVGSLFYGLIHGTSALGGRLLRVGNTAKMGDGRRSIPQADRPHHQERI